MAKKKRRRLKKKIKKVLELTAVGLMFLLLFGIYSIGQSQRGLNDSSLPKTNLDLTAYAKGIDVSVWQNRSIGNVLPYKAIALPSSVPVTAGLRKIRTVGWLNI